MNNQNLAIRIKDLRKRKGLSQEQLSEDTRLSLRTIQRVEKGESVPRGDTLIRLTQALGVTPDDLLEYTNIEDRGYLVLMNLSAFGLLFHPILGIIIPLVMWILKREKINNVEDTGKKLISFQITWTILIFLTLVVLTSGQFIPFNFNFLQSLPNILSELNFLTLIILLLYLYNIVLIIINTRKSRNGIKNSYFPAIPFLR